MPNQFRQTRRKLKAAGVKRNRARAEVVTAAGDAAPNASSEQTAAAAAAAGATRVGLKFEAGWHKRNFLTEVLLPSLFAPRSGVAQPAPGFPLLAAGQIGITWIGHASFLLQMAGLNILVDPVWNLWLKGIKRLRQPGVALHALPMIDLVLVTHAHFDHLDRRTLRAVAANQPIVVPFGVGNLVHDLGFQRVHELDYWRTLTLGEGETQLEITLTPCHHWGAPCFARSTPRFRRFRPARHGGRAERLSLRRHGVFRRLQRNRPALSRGDRAPAHRRLRRAEQARRPHEPRGGHPGFLELGAQTLVPMHYGTFRLSYEPLAEPPARLLARAAEAGVAEKVRVMNEGEPGVF